MECRGRTVRHSAAHRGCCAKRIVGVRDVGGKGAARRRADLDLAARLEGVEVEASVGGGGDAGRCTQPDAVDASSDVLDAVRQAIEDSKLRLEFRRARQLPQEGGGDGAGLRPAPACLQSDRNNFLSGRLYG